MAGRKFTPPLKVITPKPGPDLCAGCEHERHYHTSAGCRIEQCGCEEFTRTRPRGHDDADLLAAVRKVLEGFESGVFIRDNSRDHEPAWPIRLLPYISALSTLARAVEASQ